MGLHVLYCEPSAGRSRSSCGNHASRRTASTAPGNVAAPTRPSPLIRPLRREDDYALGVLHSRAHELWALRMGTWLGVANDPRYTPTSTSRR